MTNAEYLIISAINYDESIHPGAQPIHQANATAAQITEANRQYDATLIQVTGAKSFLYLSVSLATNSIPNPISK
jgi:hypothetical protein